MNGPATPPSITTSSPLPSALTGTVYSQTLMAAGATPITWAVTGGTLPAGLTLGPSTGLLSGMPAAVGVFTFSVSAANASGSNSKQLSLTVNAPATPPSITTSSPLPTAVTGAAYSQILMAASTTPITWAVTGGTLPAGLSLGSSTGILSGTPTAAGNFTLTVRATNAGGSNSKQLSLTVNAASAPPPSISLTELSAPTVLGQGESHRFTANVPVVWSMAPGSAGSIDSDGDYHAPAQVKAKQSLGGCQVLPNNHVFNTRIDNLPVHAKSSTWMAAATGGTVNYGPVFAVNATTSALPTTDMVFAYTPMNNGPFRVPATPDLRMESGWYTPYFSHFDRHIAAVETDSCVLQEMYNFYPVGANTYNPCPLCNSQSGVRYSSSAYALPAGATDAAGLPLLPLSFHRDEILANSIQHALRVTVPAASVSATNIWPAKAYAGYNRNDVLPFGARVRLKASYASSSPNPYTQTLLRQLKQYGLLIADIGYAWQIQGADMDLFYDPQITAAFDEIRSTLTPQNLEVVDESALMTSADSGFTRVGAEIVVATRVSDGTSVQMPVVLTGVTIGTEDHYLTFQAGSPGKQINAWVHGAADTSISWRMQPETRNADPRRRLHAAVQFDERDLPHHHGGRECRPKRDNHDQGHPASQRPDTDQRGRRSLQGLPEQQLATFLLHNQFCLGLRGFGIFR